MAGETTCRHGITDRNDGHREYVCVLFVNHDGPHNDGHGSEWTDDLHFQGSGSLLLARVTAERDEAKGHAREFVKQRDRERERANRLAADLAAERARREQAEAVAREFYGTADEFGYGKCENVPDGHDGARPWNPLHRNWLGTFKEHECPVCLARRLWDSMPDEAPASPQPYAYGYAAGLRKAVEEIDGQIAVERAMRAGQVHVPTAEHLRTCIRMEIPALAPRASGESSAAPRTDSAVTAAERVTSSVAPAVPDTGRFSSGEGQP